MKISFFNPTLEWDSLPDATYSGLGSHNCDCFTSTGSISSSSSSYVVYPNPANNNMKEMRAGEHMLEMTLKKEMMKSGFFILLHG